MGKRIGRLGTLIALLLALLLTACGWGTKARDQPKLLIMATSADYPPYEFLQDSSGSPEIQGFDVEVAQQISHQLGYQLQMVNLDFDQLIPALQSRQVDFVMAGLVPTEARMQKVDFTQPYYAAQNAILSRKGSKLKTPASLRKKRVGVQQNSIQAQRAMEIPGADVKTFERIQPLIQALKAGQIEAAIIENIVLKPYLVANPELVAHVIPNIPGQSGAAIAFPKGSPLIQAFDTVIWQMKLSGQLDQLVLKWFGDDPVPKAVDLKTEKQTEVRD